METARLPARGEPAITSISTLTLTKELRRRIEAGATLGESERDDLATCVIAVQDPLYQFNVGAMALNNARHLVRDYGTLAVNVHTGERISLEGAQGFALELRGEGGAITVWKDDKMLTLEQAARALGISIEALRKRIVRARKDDKWVPFKTFGDVGKGKLLVDEIALQKWASAYRQKRT